MGTDYAITPKNSASYAVDLTSTDINPSAAPTSTPRQGGFTLRNRINFTNVGAANKKIASITKATAATSGYVLRVLEVPERTLVRDVQVFAVKDETIPGVQMVDKSGSAGVTASGLGSGHLASLVIGINAEQRSKPASSSSYAAASHLDLLTGAQQGLTAGCCFGNIATATTSSGSNLSQVAFSSSVVEKIDSSMTAPELGKVVTAATGSGSAYYEAVPQYFPLGGYVYLAAGHGIATGSDSDGAGSFTGDNIQLTGTWELQADCTYVPE